jgi:Arc/MetJ family transcription regulator
MASKTKAQIRDKRIKLDQAKLDEARRILGAKTERETVEQALDLVIAEEKLNRLLEELKGRGAIHKIFH